MTVELRVIRNDVSIRARRRAQERAERGFLTVVEPIVEPVETIVAHSIEEFGRREWDSLFHGEPEDWHYFRALERAQIERCEPIYFAVRSRGRLVAAAPAFVGSPALAEPPGLRGSDHKRRSRALVLGSPFAAACPIGVAPATAAERELLVDRLLRAARDEWVLRDLDEILVSAADPTLADACRRAASLLLAPRGASAARISLPRWSLADYLSCLDDGLREQLLRICARATRYEREWCVDLDRNLEPMLALCGDAGLDEIGEKFFRELLGSNTVSADCLLVRSGDGGLAGFSIVLHGRRALHEKVTVVSRRESGALVRGIVWLETLRFCLERGIGVYESASELSISAARPNELVQRSGWVAAHVGVAVP